MHNYPDNAAFYGQPEKPALSALAYALLPPVLIPPDGNAPVMAAYDIDRPSDRMRHATTRL